MNRLHVGWVGLGIMGGPMAANLLRAGFAVTGFNRTPAKLEAFARAGGATAASSRAVAEICDVVVTMVSDTPDVEQVLFGPAGIAEGARAGQIVIDMSTVSPAATRGFSARLRAEGVGYLDAPVSGGETGAKAATLSIMVGGERADFERCRPIFEALGKQITFLGPSGSGQAAKLCNQIMVLGTLVSVCEGLLLGHASGLDPKQLIEALSGGAAVSWQLTHLGPKIVARDFAPGFLVSLASKDFRLVLEAAAELGLPLPGAALSQQLLSSVVAAGGGTLGTQALVLAVERLAEEEAKRRA